MTKQDELQQKFVAKTIKFFKTNKAGYLDLAMRFGKCKTTIDVLIDMEVDSILIAYPDNKLRETWHDECRTWGYDNPNITYVNFSSLKKYTDQIYDFVSKNLDKFSDDMFDYDVLSLLQGGNYVDAPLLSNSAFPPEFKEKFEALIKQIEGRKK